MSKMKVNAGGLSSLSRKLFVAEEEEATVIAAFNRIIGVWWGNFMLRVFAILEKIRLEVSKKLLKGKRKNKFNEDKSFIAWFFYSKKQKSFFKMFKIQQKYKFVT